MVHNNKFIGIWWMLFFYHFFCLTVNNIGRLTRTACAPAYKKVCLNRGMGPVGAMGPVKRPMLFTVNWFLVADAVFSNG